LWSVWEHIKKMKILIGIAKNMYLKADSDGMTMKIKNIFMKGNGILYLKHCCHLKNHPLLQAFEVISFVGGDVFIFLHTG